jgi:CheY-like chemotaxis protein
MATSELPDVILLDFMLTDLDGLSVCEILSGQALIPDVPGIHHPATGIVGRDAEKQSTLHLLLH